MYPSRCYYSSVYYSYYLNHIQHRSTAQNTCHRNILETDLFTFRPVSPSPSPSQFCINSFVFIFQATTRVKLIFLNKLFKFWELQVAGDILCSRG